MQLRWWVVPDSLHCPDQPQFPSPYQTSTTKGTRPKTPATMSASASASASPRSLETVHSKALARYEELHQSGEITDSEYDMIRRHGTSLSDLLDMISESQVENENARSSISRRFHAALRPALERFERFAPVVDTMIQSSKLEHLACGLGLLHRMSADFQALRSLP